MEGGQSDTYLRLTRASSGPRVSIAKTYRDETKMNILARSQWPSSAVEYRRLKRNFKCHRGEGGMWGLTDIEIGGVS